MRTPSLALIAGSLVVPAAAQAGTITVTLPRPAVAEYKKPYVAGWIEPAAGGTAKSLFVWYDVRKQGNEPGTKSPTCARGGARPGGRCTCLPTG